ncbi:polysaccharide pyruvyl transferase CsaB [Bengtsoniella intestinalis]|uniref:polysaccharide pyruvyl transferase CsaB n=1 Tax=Bengtsoniella intestinalis TaxID=3073143 RepID=UPI00391EE36A
MKILHLISGGDFGGAKTHVLSLLEQLGKTIDVEMVCFRDGPFAQEAIALGIKTTVMTEANRLLSLRKRLTEYVKENNFTLIHCHGSRANLVGALLRQPTGLPVISTVHSDYRLDYMGRPFSQFTLGNINAWALRHLDYRIGVSDSMVDLLIKRNFPANRFYAIYNGIEFIPPQNNPDRLAYLRNLGANVDTDSVVVGIAARLNPVKDMSTLIRGFAKAYQKCNRLRLVIAGDGEELEKLQALAAELGVTEQVCFAGWISGGMDAFYGAMDINALTSVSETFPYALTEGSRFRLATVSSAVGGIPALIDQGVNGFLFTPTDWESLGNHLATLALNDDLRHSMGEKLYQKASTQFSIQKTVDTQIHIYEEVHRRHMRPKKNRDGVVICGAYGRGNAGDDAILEAILQQMKEIDKDMPITVLSKNPSQTRLAYRVASIHRSNFFAWRKAMKTSKLYISGGGSLIQDITSRRSLWFYLNNIRTAKRMGNFVQMYGCGIGPIIHDSHKKLVAKSLNRYVDVITLREPDSQMELASMGVHTPEIRLTADPALVLAPDSNDKIDSVLLGSNIPPNGKYIGFTLRQWQGFADKTTAIAQAATYAYETYGLTPVFIAIEKHLDPSAGRAVAKHLTVPYYFLDDAGSAGTIIGALSRMELVVSMRLHALIFAAGQGIPLVGLVYDPKVSAFLRYIGQEGFVDLSDITAEGLESLIDQAHQKLETPQIQTDAVAKIQALEFGNEAVARQALER